MTARRHEFNFMPHSRFRAGIVACALVVAGPLAADILTVGMTGCNFTSIQAAVDAAQSGDELRLRTQGFVENVNIDKSLTIVGGFDACSDSAPNQLTTITGQPGAGESVVELNAQGINVVLRKLAIVGGEDDGRGGGLEIGLNSTVEVDEITVALSESELGGGIYLDASAKLLRRGPLIVTNNTATRGGGIYAGSSSLIDFASGTPGEVSIHSNSANPSGQGGGIWLGNNAELRTDGASAVEITDNESLSGGGIYVGAGSSIDADMMTVEGNLGGNGGGVHVAGPGGATPVAPTIVFGNDTTIRDNQALGGGCIFLDDAGGHALAFGGRCITNEAIDGAGINMQGQGRLVVSGLLDRNAAVGNGGGLYADAGEIELTGTLAGNSAGAGGGAYLSFVDIVADAATIVGNTATNDGGGIRIANGDLTAGWRNGLGTRFIENISTQGDGGAIHISNGDLLLEFANVGIGNRGNRAPMGAGGGIHHSGFGDSTLINAWVIENSADTGGGIYYGGDGRLTVTADIMPDGIAPARGTASPQCEVALLLPDRYCSEIRGNYADAGGGVYIDNSQASFLPHKIRWTALIDNVGNLASAIVAVDAHDLWVRTTLIHGNRDNGDGPNVGVVRTIGNTALVLDNATIVDNTGIGLVLSGSTTLTNNVLNNIFSANTIDVFAVPGTDAILGCNFSRDGTLPGTVVGANERPQFIETARGPYRLSDLSPALDVCSAPLSQDLDGLTRPIGLTHDAGAFEGAWGIPELVFRDGFE